jgi:hypothetical protein
MLEILTYVHLKLNQIRLNNEIVYEENHKDFDDFLNEAYRKAELNYPKFFKMDRLCKMGMMGAHFAIKNHLDLIDSIGTNMIFNNRSSSLTTDRQHWNSISDKANYFPSPAVFVYTLPNIVLGEIAIRYKLYGENEFFVSEIPDFNFLCSYSEILMKKQTAKNILFAVIEPEGEQAKLFMAFAKKIEIKRQNFDTFIEFNPENLNLLYNQKNG